MFVFASANYHFDQVEASLPDLFTNFINTEDFINTDMELRRSARNQRSGCRLEKSNKSHEELIQNFICRNSIARMWLETKICGTGRDCFDCDINSVKIPHAHNGLEVSRCVTPVYSKYDRLASKYLCYINARVEYWGFCFTPTQMMNALTCQNHLMTYFFDEHVEQRTLLSCCQKELESFSNPVSCIPREYSTTNLKIFIQLRNGAVKHAYFPIKTATQCCLEF